VPARALIWLRFHLSLQLGSIRQNNSIAAGGAPGAQGVLFVPVEFGPPPNFFGRASGDLLLVPAQLEAVAGERARTHKTNFFCPLAPLVSD
jgi:hypothetical protein